MPQPGATRHEALTDYIWQHIFKCDTPGIHGLEGMTFIWNAIYC